MQDRKYQVEHIEKIIEEVSSKRKVCAQLPTGGGKTVEFVKIAQRYTRNTDKAVLILVNREELMYQAEKAIISIMGIKPYLITSQSSKFYISRVYIGMVGSTVSRLNLFHDVGLVIVDECHIAEFNKVHSIFIEELIIGFSATPLATSKKEPLNKYYHCIVTGPQIKELISLGFLSQNITRCPKDVVDSTKFEMDKLKGDYNERQMASEYRKVKHVSNVVKSYHRFCKGEKTIIFNVNIEHSIQVTECFVACGFNARHLDSDSSKRPSKDPRYKSEREEILGWFKETKDAILCNVMIATFGFDEPTVRNVFLNFSTLSLGKFIQASGRGSRAIGQEWLEKFQPDYPYQEREKYHFNVIDMGGNCVRFGDWNDDRDWDYIFANPSKANDGVAPVKTCPECEGLVHASLTICPLTNEKGELCLYEWIKKKTQEEVDLEEMILITKGIDVDAIIDKSRKKYEYYPMLELCVEVVNRMYDDFPEPGELAKTRYFNIYYSLCIQWYNKTLGGINGNISDITNSYFHIKMARNNFINLTQKYKPQIVQDTKDELDIIAQEEEATQQELEFTKAQYRLNRGY